jgi:hypothetical protein
VYYSTFGGGNLMPDILYSGSILEIPRSSIINAVANINEKIGVFTSNTLYLVNPSTESGQLLFTVKASLEFGVKDFNDLVEIQGGVAIHTIHGIYSSTGYQSTLLSEPIDDIVKSHYNTGRIYYNKSKHELLYKPTDEEDLYRFRFKDAVWEKINKTITGVMVEQSLELS